MGQTTALLMAGGLGTRMAASHPGRPKPLVEIAGKSLIEINLRRLFAAGVDDVRIALRHESTRIREHVLALKDLPLSRIEFLVEPEPLGTAGSLWWLREASATVLLTNADLLSAIDLSAMLEEHRRRGSDLTIATHDEHIRLKLGEVLVGPENAIYDYLEKPVKSYRISSGTYLLEPSVLALLERPEWLGFPALARKAITAKLRIFEHHHGEAWLDVNDAADLAQARELMARDPSAFGFPAGIDGEHGQGGGRWLGLDVGGTKILAALVDERAQVLRWKKIDSPRADGPAAVLAACAELAREVIDGEECAGVGVGFAGLVDHAQGKVLSSIILPGWNDYPLAHELEQLLGLPCTVDNDATTAAIGEFAALGAPAGLNLVVLTVGTGIGGALFVDGRLHRGATGTAGEFGNMTIDWQGEPCWCPNRGCLNTLASGTAIERHALAYAKEAGSPLAKLSEPRLEDVARAAAAGDRAAARAIDEGARALGAGLANIVNTLAPDRVSLCGGVVELGDAWLESVRAECARRAFAEPMKHVRIERALRGPQSGAVGAAWLAREGARHT